MKLRAPSPALVISVIALVSALSATAYAATRITSSSQIRNGAVTGADIKNHSLHGGDIHSGTIRIGNLAKSVTKRLGGGSGSDATATETLRRTGPLNQPANQLVQVISTTIPAGAYVITAKTTMAGIVQQPGLLQNGVVAATGTCKLNAGGVEDQADTVIAVESRETPSTMNMQLTRTLGSTATIEITCASSVPWNAVNTSIIAEQVSSAHSAEASGD